MTSYSSDYKTRLLYLTLLPLMCILEISDNMLLVKSLKFPSTNFTINNYILFSTNSTLSSRTHVCVCVHVHIWDNFT